MNTREFYIGERVSFAFPNEDAIYNGFIRAKDSQAMYGIVVYAKSKGTYISNELYEIAESWIRGVLPEPALDERVAQRFIDHPNIRMVYHSEGVRFLMQRRDTNGVGHIDLECEYWPRRNPAEATPPSATGTVTGMIGVQFLLLSLRALEVQMRENLHAAALQAGKEGE